MVKKSFEEKVAFIKESRHKNYKESLRLEGITASKKLHGKTKEEIISYYKSKK